MLQWHKQDVSTGTKESCANSKGANIGEYITGICMEWKSCNLAVRTKLSVVYHRWYLAGEILMDVMTGCLKIKVHP